MQLSGLLLYIISCDAPFIYSESNQEFQRLSVSGKPFLLMVKVFDYIESLGCFVINPDFKAIVDYLGVSEWHEAVWIGRCFMLDNDYGEHWLDTWTQREELQEKAEALGYDHEFLMIVNPERMYNNKDGPCHTYEERKQFWKDVMKSLHLSLETIFMEARKFSQEAKENHRRYFQDMEERIEKIKLTYDKK